MTLPETLTVQAEVQSKEELPDGTIGIKILAKELSNYPLPGTFHLSPEEAPKVKKGQTITCTLCRGRQRPNTKGDSKFHYYWDWVGLGRLTTPSLRDATGETNHEDIPEAPESAPEARDPTRMSIERQKALAEAVTLYTTHVQYFLSKEEPPTQEQMVNDLLWIADALSAWLSKPVKEAPDATV